MNAASGMERMLGLKKLGGRLPGEYNKERREIYREDGYY